MADKYIEEFARATEAKNDDLFLIDQDNLTKSISLNTLITKLRESVLFPGTIMMYPSILIPSGWLECNGQTLSTLDSLYTNLFNIIGYTFGGSNNTFNVPDFRGVFPRGLDNGRGIDGGRTLEGSIQEDMFQGHGHFLASSSYSTKDDPANQTVTRLGGDNTNDSNAIHSANFVVDYVITPKTTGSYGTAKFGNETRPKNLATVFCIKY